MSEADFEDDEDNEDDEDEDQAYDEVPDEPIDIRSLVQSNGRRSRQDEQVDSQPPGKKQKQKR